MEDELGLANIGASILGRLSQTSKLPMTPLRGDFRRVESSVLPNECHRLPGFLALEAKDVACFFFLGGGEVED